VLSRDDKHASAHNAAETAGSDAPTFVPAEINPQIAPSRITGTATIPPSDDRRTASATSPGSAE
jgi:hypothetical protein